MPSNTIERFLDPKLALEYAMKHHNFVKVLREVFSGPAYLEAAYTADILLVDRFMVNLADALSSDQTERKRLANKWASFLKLRTNGMEVWSSICASFGALFTAASAWLVLSAEALKSDKSYYLLGSMLLAGVGVLVCKFYIDRRAHWYKYVVACLETLSKS